MIVIILNGPAESGKGTFLELIQEIYSLRSTKYSSIAWAKQTAIKQWGWDGNKDPESRELIGKIKQLGIKYGDIPFKKVIGMYRRSFANHDDIFVTDVREPPEIKKLVDYFRHIRIKCLTIRIQNTEKEQYAAKNLGIADNEYAQYNYDLIIPNNGTIEDFRKSIEFRLENQLNFVKEKM